MDESEKKNSVLYLKQFARRTRSIYYELTPSYSNDAIHVKKKFSKQTALDEAKIKCKAQLPYICGNSGL